MLSGRQKPRVLTRPEYSSEAWGQEAVDLAASVGLDLDPWQQLLVRLTLATRPDGKYAADTVAALVARQNGKGAWLEAVVLHGMFLVRDPLTLWTAHQTKTSFEGFLRLKGWIDGSDDLRSRVKRINNSHGEEGIELLGGPRVRFLARSKSSGRGFSPQRIVFDEAQELAAVAQEAMVPAMKAQANKQAIYTGTVPGPDINHPEAFRRLRDRGRAGGSKRLAWAEWSPVGSDDPNRAEKLDLSDRKLWAQSNPALGFRVTEESLDSDFETMSREAFAREDLAIWPSQPGDGDGDMDQVAWLSATDPAAELVGTPVLSVSVSNDKRWTTVGTAGRAADGRQLVMVKSFPGLDAAEVARLAGKHGLRSVALNPASKALSLVTDLEDAGLTVRKMKSLEMKQACLTIQKDVIDGRVVHLGQKELDATVRVAKVRVLNGAEMWDARTLDVSPLDAVTVAKAVLDEDGNYDVLDSVF